jgi:hypothetical protein
MGLESVLANNSIVGMLPNTQLPGNIWSAAPQNLFPLSWNVFGFWPIPNIILELKIHPLKEGFPIKDRYGHFRSAEISEQLHTIDPHHNHVLIRFELTVFIRKNLHFFGTQLRGHIPEEGVDQ